MHSYMYDKYLQAFIALLFLNVAFKTAGELLKMAKVQFSRQTKTFQALWTVGELNRTIGLYHSVEGCNKFVHTRSRNGKNSFIYKCEIIDR
jgi:hypothetical protein